MQGCCSPETNSRIRSGTDGCLTNQPHGSEKQNKKHGGTPFHIIQKEIWNQILCFKIVCKGNEKVDRKWKMEARK